MIVRPAKGTRSKWKERRDVGTSR